MSSFQLTDDQLETYRQDGFVVVDEFLSQEQVELLSKISRADHQLAQEASSRADGEGGSVKITVRNDLPEDDIYGAIVRGESLVNAMELLLEDEVYHYHHKMVLKEPLEGGAWAWHQDYGYWYNYCCPFPQLASCLVAVDRATRENGCLQVIRGSHRMGRVDHGTVGDQTGADPERVQVALERLELVHCELEPGSAILFHCNLLHRSDQNKSEHPRWAFICCYNAAGNDPFRTVRHPRYTPLEKWPDERILEIGGRQWKSLGQPLA
jgi:ectoine hydroxylase-related dioxygenase (phytanoyl-CoA dioxygenase family)